jgi:mycofactocin precursor
MCAGEEEVNMTETGSMTARAAVEPSGAGIALESATADDTVTLEDELLSDEELENLLLLEITIDGMCGVY